MNMAEAARKVLATMTTDPRTKCSAEQIADQIAESLSAIAWNAFGVDVVQDLVVCGNLVNTIEIPTDSKKPIKLRINLPRTTENIAKITQMDCDGEVLLFGSEIIPEGDSLQQKLPFNNGQEER